MMDENDQRELQRLATDISRIRSRTDAGSIQAAEEAYATGPTDPALDPSSASFDLYRYLEHIIGLLRKEGITTAQAGVAFTDLTVSGTGDALQLQDTIADWIQMPLRIGEFFSFRKKEHRTILNSFDGIVNSGELLIVLGRPGSGCSTLLKSMTGQLHGLTMNDNSVVHYNGIPQHQMMKEFKGEAIYNQEVSRARSTYRKIHVLTHLTRSTSTSLTSRSARPSNSPPPAERPPAESRVSHATSTWSTSPVSSWPSAA